MYEKTYEEPYEPQYHEPVEYEVSYVCNKFGPHIYPTAYYHDSILPFHTRKNIYNILHKPQLHQDDERVVFTNPVRPGGLDLAAALGLTGVGYVANSGGALHIVG